MSFGDLDLAGILDDEVVFTVEEFNTPMKLLKAVKQNPEVMEAVAMMSATQGGRSPRMANSMPDMQMHGNRKDMLGLGQTTIGIGATVNINLTPQSIFRPDKLVLSAALAAGGAGVLADILVNDIRIGQQSQFVAAGAVSGIMYQNDTTDGSFRFDTCQVGQLIVVQVTNVNAAAQIVSGGFIGKTLTK